MSLLTRIVLLFGIAAFLALRLWLAVLGLAHFAGPALAVVVVAILLILRWRILMWAAVLYGAVVLWHWPIVPALLVAVPRALLVLPGLIATLLALWRHPRPRWAPYVAPAPTVPETGPVG